MALDNEQSLLYGRMAWSYESTNTGFEPTLQKETDLSFSYRPSSAYDYNLVYKFTMLAGTTEVVDFYGPNVVFSGESVTAVKLIGFWLKATGSGGILTIAPDATAGLEWPFNSTGVHTITPGTVGGGWVHQDGTQATVSGSAKRWLLTNTGAATLTVWLVAFVGD